MKKNYALLLLSVAALTANAQQINGDFDSEWEKCGLSGNLVGISINLCKSIQKELFINDAP